MDETNDPVVNEGQSEAETTETASEPSKDEGQSEANELESEVKALPDNIRGEVEKATKKILKKYYDKSQEFADNRKVLEAERSQRDIELQRLRNLSREILQDPAKVEAYRSVYGKELGIQPSESKRDDETVEQFENRIKAEFDQKLAAREVQMKSEQRWKDTWDQYLIQPEFKGEIGEMKIKVIYDMIKNNPNVYLSRYNGTNEKQVIEAAVKDFRKIVEHEKEVAKKEALELAKKKKENQTMAPTKPAMKVEQGRKKSKSEIIAEIQSELGGG